MPPMYNVPIIPQNLRREETVVQIADALNYLSETANDVFNRINKRIESNNQQLSTLVNRIEDAHSKVSTLKGAKKATQVFSSSKYPAVDVHRNYKSVFGDMGKLEITRSNIKYKDVPFKSVPNEPLQLYHVKLNNPNLQEDIGGLGSVPCDVNSINDLLLYNTGTNPYKKYIISDPLQSSITTKKEDSADTTTEICAAPHSISDRTTLTRSATESYFYAPHLGDVPRIDVPLDLPDLPGIANDLRYVDERGQGIAPSVTTTPNIPDLPPLVEVPQEPEEIANKVVPPPPPPVEIIQPPVPPILEQEELNLPAPERNDKAETPAKSVNNVVNQPMANSDNAHAMLMEAIRKAGGSKNANLKAAEPKKAVVGTDLMADLHAKLSLRRKGISGSKNQEIPQFDANSTMNKVSAMIPPPPPKHDYNESTNTEDEDWDE
ncbi:hypothetical protein PPYR_05877 [Photinus pyralis]|uniref:WASH1 WAHD domain-containing protein n=1 Tax=Photinus pyralis TaxID=7054 RepID=A0A5N4AW91_PHOPY|nr:WASH complex subunit 1 [Photinus pyralis]KAB0801523.1 hypothetical protein PPYR_05877 [Photinus pyralis]